MHLVFVFVILIFTTAKSFGQRGISEYTRYVQHSKAISDSINSFFQHEVDEVVLRATEEIDTSGFIPKNYSVPVAETFAAKNSLLCFNDKSSYTMFYRLIKDEIYFEIIDNRVLDIRYPPSKKKLISIQDYQKLQSKREGLRFLLRLNENRAVEQMFMTKVYYD
jgi:hypothetical protein